MEYCTEAYLRYADIYKSANAALAIEKLEQLLHHQIQFISVGAERNQYLTKGELL